VNQPQTTSKMSPDNLVDQFPITTSSLNDIMSNKKKIFQSAALSIMGNKTNVSATEYPNISTNLNNDKFDQIPNSFGENNELDCTANDRNVTSVEPNLETYQNNEDKSEGHSNELVSSMKKNNDNINLHPTVITDSHSSTSIPQSLVSQSLADSQIYNTNNAYNQVPISDECDDVKSNSVNQRSLQSSALLDTLPTIIHRREMLPAIQRSKNTATILPGTEDMEKSFKCGNELDKPAF
jgi:hypothetical protein